MFRYLLVLPVMTGQFFSVFTVDEFGIRRGEQIGNITAPCRTRLGLQVLTGYCPSSDIHSSLHCANCHHLVLSGGNSRLLFVSQAHARSTILWHLPRCLFSELHKTVDVLRHVVSLSTRSNTMTWLSTIWIVRNLHICQSLGRGWS